MRKDAQAILGYSRPPAYSPESWRHARAGMRLFVKASDRCVSAARAKNVAALKSVVAISGRGSAELRVATALAKR